MATEYRRGTGPNALPQGAAAALNAMQPKPDPGLDDDIPVQFVGRPEPDDEPVQGEDLQILLDGPDPEYRPTMMRGQRPGRVPTYVVRHLPQLIAAAADPSAPPTLIALKNSILRHLEDEMRRGG